MPSKTQRTINYVAKDEERFRTVELLCKASAKFRSNEIKTCCNDIEC